MSNQAMMNYLDGYRLPLIDPGMDNSKGSLRYLRDNLDFGEIDLKSLQHSLSLALLYTIN